MKQLVRFFHKNAEKFLFSLTLLLLPTQLGKHFWPSFSLPYGFRIDYLSPTLYLSDVALVLLFLVVVVQKRYLVGVFIDSLLKKHRASLFFVVTCGWLLLVSVFAPFPFLSLYGIWKFLECAFFAWYSATTPLVTPKRLVIMFSTGVLLQALLVFWQYSLQHSVGGLWYFLGERFFTSLTPEIAIASVHGVLVLRPYGTFSHPNVLGGYLLISLTLILVLSKQLRGSFIMQSARLSLALGSVALLLSLSRVAIILWVGTLCWFGIQSVRKKKQLSFVLLALLSFALLGMSTVTLSSRFLGISFTQQATQERIALVQQAVVLVAASPMVGVGLLHFIPSLPSSFIPLQPVHNIFLLIAAETGLIGCILFLCLFFYVWKRMQQTRDLSRQALPYLLFFQILIIGLFDHYFLTLQQGQLLFAFCLGFCCRGSATIQQYGTHLYRRGRARQSRSRSSRRLYRK